MVIVLAVGSVKEDAGEVGAALVSGGGPCDGAGAMREVVR